MKRLLWILAWIAVAVWSLFAWGAYGLLDLFGGLASRNADVVTSNPETVEWLSWGLSTLSGLGLAAIVVVWGVVSLLILAVPAAASLILGRASPSQRQPQWPMREVNPGATGGYPPAPNNPIRRIERR
jgi:hypothetical protein